MRTHLSKAKIPKLMTKTSAALETFDYAQVRFSVPSGPGGGCETVHSRIVCILRPLFNFSFYM